SEFSNISKRATKMKATYVLALCIFAPSILVACRVSAPVERVDGVCIVKRPGLRYLHETRDDFAFLSVFKGSSLVAQIYVGQFPHVEGPNRALLSLSGSDPKRGHLVPLKSPQEGEFLGVPRTY